MAAVLVFIQVIRAHDSPGLSFLDSGFEGRQVDFVQGAVVYDYVGRVAVHFLVVQCVVFHTGGYTVLLNALYVGNHHLSGQVRVFAHIFEVTPVQW